MRHRIQKSYSRPTDKEEESTPRKKTKKRGGGLKMLVRVMLVLVVLAAFIALAINWKDLAPDSFVAWVEDVVGGTTGGTYPVSITGDNVVDMQEVGGNLVMLTDTATVYYNEHGGESVRRTCSYARPLLRVKDKYVLLLETGGYRFRLETRSDVELDHTLSGKIVTGNVSAKGDVAVVLESTQSHLSEVLVFSAKGKERYQWLSSDWIVLDCAFSTDGNSLAVTACKTQGGSMQSTLLVFDLRSADTQPKQYLADSTLYTSVSYMNSGTVVAIGDTHCRFVNPTGSLDARFDMTDSKVSGVTFGNNLVAVATSTYGTQNAHQVHIFSSSGDLRATHTIEGEFRDLSTVGGRVLALTDQYIYELDGTAVSHQTPVEADSLMTGAVVGHVVVLGLTELSEIMW